MMRDKIQSLHLKRRAYVYIRQSTAAQVFSNTESTARQYALVERARALGWPEGAVDVIDEDLGRSGATADERNGLRRLAQAVAHGKAGAIFTLEVSRLARSSQDWQRLLALCAVAQVVVCDEHAIYDPREADGKRGGTMGAPGRVSSADATQFRRWHERADMAAIEHQPA